MNIKDFKFKTDLLSIAMERIEQERVVDNPKSNQRKIDNYKRSLDYALSLWDGSKGKIVLYDLPEREIEYHGIVVELFQDDFEGKDKEMLTSIIEACDCMNIVGDNKGNITLQFIFDGLYESGA